MNLSELLRPRRDGPGRFLFDVPDGWQQGRGAFGGLVVGALVRALEAEIEPERTLRSLSAELVGPLLPGPAELRTEVLRTGRTVSTIAIRAVQGDGVQAHAVGVFGGPRVSEFDRLRLERPAAPPWKDVEIVPVGPPVGAVFGPHFEFRSAAALPLSGGAPEALGYIRPKDPGPDRGAAYVAACIDAFWPTLWVELPMPRPMATVGYTLQLAADLSGLDPASPLLFRSTCLAIHDGYLLEQRELWRPDDGRLVALNAQTFVVIK